MSRRGNCWDNAPMESFFGHAKDELHLRRCPTFDGVASEIAEFEAFVNSSVTSYRKIEIICEAKTDNDCSGSFTILDWYISE